MSDYKIYMINSTDYVLTYEEIDKMKSWYLKETGQEADEIEEVNRYDCMYMEIDSNEWKYKTIFPQEECLQGQYTAICGDIYKKITFDEARKNLNYKEKTYFIASTEV